MKEIELKKIRDPTNEFTFGYLLKVNREFFEDMGGDEMICQSNRGFYDPKRDKCQNFIELPAFYCKKTGLLYCRDCEHKPKEGINTCGYQNEDGHIHFRIIQIHLNDKEEKEVMENENIKN